jgi:hypothetical protein
MRAPFLLEITVRELADALIDDLLVSDKKDSEFERETDDTVCCSRLKQASVLQ